MADGSTKVVYAALAGNVFVAVSKFGAAFVSGSAAMLTEAIHSSADTSNQILLLIGNRRSRAEPDETNQFGYGMEVYFWTFVVAVIVLLAGGVASLWQGIVQLRAPEAIRSPVRRLRRARALPGVRGLVARRGLPGIQARRARPAHRRREGEPLALHRRLQGPRPLREPARGLRLRVIGIVIAAIGVLASVYLGALWADGAASLAIGVLLIADSFVIASATRSLVAGESAAPPVIGDITRAVRRGPHSSLVTDIKTLQLGPRCIMVALTVHRRGAVESLQDPAFDELRAAIRAVDERIFYIYFSIDDPHV